MNMMNRKLSLSLASLLTLIIIFLTIFLLALVSGVVFMSTHSTSAADTSLDVAVTLDPVISITTDATNGALSIPITPTSGGAFASSDLTVSVLTNNSTGYTLLMSSSTANTSLEHTVDTAYTIPTTTHTTSAPGTLAANTWGYSRWADGQSAAPSTFSRIPALASPDTLRTTTEVAGATDTKLTFGAVVSAAMASGSYANTVTFTATSNYVPEVLPFMQDFGVAECSALDAGETVRMRDSRDSKIYRVKKMIDSHCWMIENLAYELNSQSAPTYTPAATLISEPTTMLGDRAQYAAATADYNTVDGETTYLYNWCAALGDTSNSCSSSVSAAMSNTVINGTIDTTGTTTTQPEVTGICPAPFRLPKGGPEATGGNAATTANEFVKLDIAMGGTGTNRNAANTYTYFAGVTAADRDWSGVFAGYYGPNRIINYEIFGYFWSSTADFSGRANNLYIGSSGSAVLPGGSLDRKYGFSVRCVI